MGKGISSIVGRAARGDGSEVPLYRALRSILCSSCGALIDEGALFTRRALGAGGPRLPAQCRKCSSFIQLADDEKERRPSPLMESLLAPESERETEIETRQSGQVEEAVRKRLGPALGYRAGQKVPRR